MPRSTARTAFSLAGLLLLAGLAPAQSPYRAPAPPPASSPYGALAPRSDLAPPPAAPSRAVTAPVVSPVAPAAIVPADGKTLTFSKEPRRVSASVRPVIVQVQGDGGTLDPADYDIQLDPPEIERLFRLESEMSLEERIKQKASQRSNPDPKREGFPDKPRLSNMAYNGRRFGPQALLVEPAYVAYNRLYFEDVNTERYGWEIGILQPLVSAVHFYKDVILLPYHLGSYPCNKFETSAGRCLPGDPVPYLCYPPNLTLSGSLIDAGVVIGLVAIFP